jgi:hypothetical protein
MLHSAAYANGAFVVVGDEGTVLTSRDGTNWTSQTSGTTNGLFWVTYAGGTLVAVGDSGAILTSPDGTNWTSRTSGTTAALLGVAFGNGTFVVTTMGAMALALALTSPDGVTWSNHPAPAGGLLYGGVAFGNGTFAAVGYDGAVATSTDGATWSGSFLAPLGNENPVYFFDISYGNGVFVAVGQGITDDSHGLIVASPDGTNWTTVAYLSLPPYIYGVTYADGAFIAVGGGATILASAGTIAPVQPTLGLPVVSSGGILQGTVTGVPEQNYGVQASTNLVDWVPLTTVETVLGVEQFTDPAAGTFKQRFYRATVP